MSGTPFEIDFDALARLAATRKVKAVAMWCARNRILTFRDTKGRPCTTQSALDEALGHSKDPSNEPNFAALNLWASSRAASRSPVSLRKVAATTESSETNGSRLVESMRAKKPSSRRSLRSAQADPGRSGNS
jgi:hypothetical protein